MPIYEFYCADCHTIYAFLSRSVDTKRRPACPRCGRARLERKPSAFAVSRGRTEEAGPDEDMPSGMDEARLERAMASVAGEMESLGDDADPRQAARVMRRVYEAAGVPLTGGLEEALRRMEAGEDPEAVEDELGDAFDEDPLAGAAAEVESRRPRKRLVPPRKDPELYEM